MIYFVMLRSGNVKIVFTDYLTERLAALRGQYGKLILIHAMEGDDDTEAELHERFAHLRLEGDEQFRPGPDLLEFIGKPHLVPLPPGDVAVQRRKETGRWIFPLILSPRAIQHLLTSTGGELNN